MTQESQTTKALGTFTITLGDFSRTFVLAETDAPKDYDYPMTINVYNSGRLRLILVPLDRFDYQLGRNRSGLYSLTRVEIDRSKMHWLREKMYGWIVDGAIGGGA